MNEGEIQSLIDYYISASSYTATFWLSATAIFLSVGSTVATIFLHLRLRREQASEYLSSLWNSLLALGHENPRYMDLNYTENYRHRMKEDERLQYDAYCHRAWGYAREVVNKGWHKDPSFEPIFHFLISYHVKWLEQNPMLFPENEFWDFIELMKSVPHAIPRYKPLPSKDGDIDWDFVHENYHEYILGPFQPVMTERSDHQNPARNILIESLVSYPKEDISNMEILDLGSGPGNLIPHLQGKVNKVVCVDKSQNALDKAKDVGERNNVEIETHLIDYSKTESEIPGTYNIIVSVCSILPVNRKEVENMLLNIRSNLRPGGKLMAILPSFDTTEYLISLWWDHYARTTSEDHANRVIEAFKKNKKFNPDNHSYADDGVNVQCYHTPETIADEFARTGLRITRGPEPVYYPWKLTRDFDYGYFPSAPNEIWDWYIEAERFERPE